MATVVWRAVAAAWPAWLLLAVVLALFETPRLWRAWRRRRAGLARIDAMSGEEFEAFLAQLFVRLGHRVERVGAGGGDFGADLLLRDRDGACFVVQAKRYTRPVGVKAVQEVLGARGYYQADRAAVVTNSTFTAAAVKLAQANDVDLWDREQLAEAVRRSR
jgi:restriction system protein